MQRNVQGYYVVLTEQVVQNGLVPDIDADTPLELVVPQDGAIRFPKPIHIKMDPRKSLNINDDYDASSFAIGFEVLNGSVPAGSKLKAHASVEYIKFPQEIVFNERTIEIPYVFTLAKEDLKRILPEEVVVDVVFEYSCDDKQQQKYTTVSPNTFKLKIINKLQPKISISWK